MQEFVNNIFPYSYYQLSLSGEGTPADANILIAQPNMFFSKK